MRVVVAGCCLAYMFEAGMVHIIPPVLLSCLVLMLLQAAMFGWRRFPVLCLGGAGAVSLLLSAGKLTATLALLSHFPRDDYPLPGIANPLGLFALAFQALFLTIPADASRAVANSRWLVERQEWEYGVSPVPLLLIAGFLVSRLARGARRSLSPIGARAELIAAIVLLLSIPLALNWYEPHWNGLLKSLPFFQNSSNLLRWFSAYIPVVIVLAALAQDRLPLPTAARAPGRALLTGLGIVMLLVWDFHVDRNFYHHQGYDVTAIEAAYDEAAATHVVPAVTAVGVLVDSAGHLIVPVGRNDMMTQGYSQLVCYQPLFGYILEHFPIKGLRPGPVTLALDEVLNFKNPACYLFPAENACAPGDQFPSSALDKEQALASYRPFSFVLPFYARLMNIVSLTTLCGVMALLLWSAVVLVLAARRQVRDGSSHRPANLA
jgi:hypothetical protein